MKWCQDICKEHDVIMIVERLRTGPGNIDGAGMPPVHAEVVFLDPGNENRAVKFDASVLKGNALLIDTFTDDPNTTLPRLVTAVIQHPHQMTHATLETDYMDEGQLAQFSADLAADIKAQKTTEEKDAEARAVVADTLRNLGGLLVTAAEMIEPTKQQAPDTNNKGEA